MSILKASDLDAASRSDLVARAEALGVGNADVLTRVELVDEIVKRTVADPIERRLARGLLGVARDLVARVVERGLHLPDAAALIRGLQRVTLTPVTPPIATVTLAEIYAGQGHRARALAVLDEVLANEPEHAAARALHEKVAAQPEDAARPVAPSEPPPDIAAPVDPDRDPHRDHDHDHDREPDRDRDTLPPAADTSPTVAPTHLPPTHLPPTHLPPTHLPPTTWRVDAPDEPATEVARNTEVAPPFSVHDADQVVLVPVDAARALARWEIGETTLDEARARAQGGALILRIVAVTPNWDGPLMEIRDIEVVLPVGDWWVCDLPADAVLRAAIGWRDDRGFDPLAVALDVAPSEEGEAIASHEAASPPFGDSAERRVGISVRARRHAEQGRPREGQPSSSWHLLALAPWEAPYEAPAQVSAETH